MNKFFHCVMRNIFIIKNTYFLFLYTFFLSVLIASLLIDRKFQSTRNSESISLAASNLVVVFTITVSMIVKKMFHI